MSRKDYILAAKLIRAIDDRTEAGIIVNFLIDFFKKDNYRFDGGRFQEATLGKEELKRFCEWIKS